MKRGFFMKTIAVVTLVVLLASCATTRIPPISAAGTQFEPEKDEARLWKQSREEEAKLREEARIYDDPLLLDYLEDVVDRLNPPAMAANPDIRYRVTVLEEPTLNAFAFPTGSLYVHTGLLARMENEDQIATVLGHEMTHVENRHMVRYQRSIRNKQLGLGIAAVVGAVIIAGEEGDAIDQGHYGKAARYRVLSDVLIGLGLTLALVASVNGYGRDLEREADDGAFDKLIDAGYDVRQAPSVYQALLEDHGDSGKVEAFFFGSHPKLANRIDNANTWIEDHPGAPVPPTDETRSEEFVRRMRPVLRDDARLNIEMGRLELAEFELNKAIRWLPRDPVAHFLMGRLRLAMLDAEKDPAVQDELRWDAETSFREAVRLDPNLPGPHRELGLMAYRGGDPVDACVEFRQYVELDPDASDAGRIKDYLLELEQTGDCPET